MSTPAVPKLSHFRATVASAVSLLGLSLLMTPLFVRASSTISPMPGWETDPIVIPDVPSGITPSGSMWLDTLSLLGTAILLLQASRRGMKWWAILLATIGSVAVIYHGWFGPQSPNLGHQRVGLSWLSAIWGSVALLHAAREAQIRFIAIGVTLGFSALLALQGALNWFIELPQAMRSFTGNTDQILAAHGWTSGSPMAKGFERRVMQPEAAGWFGLSNVYASFAAASLVALFTMTFEALRSRRTATPGEVPPSTQQDDRAKADQKSGIAVLIIGAGAVGAAASLFFAQSKGGIVAAISGALAVVALVGLSVLLRRHRLKPRRAMTLAGLVGTGAIAGALGLVAVRGAFGERLSELSLYFRWLYAEGTYAIWKAHPWLGVGPDGFQTAYSRFKNPISPEDVTSPHSILLDYIGTLGVAGFAWALLLVIFAWCTGQTALRELESKPIGQSVPSLSHPLSRTAARVAMLIPVAATFASSHAQGILVTLEGSIVRIVGLVAWAALGWAVLRMLQAQYARSPGPGASRLGLVAGAIALLAHGQIDVAFSWGQSAGLAMMWVALAAASDPDHRLTSKRPVIQRLKMWPLGIVSVLFVGFLIGLGVSGARRCEAWEARLNAGVAALRPLTKISERLELIREAATGQRPPIQDSLRAVGVDLAMLTASPEIRDQADFSRAMSVLSTRVLPKAADELLAADAVYPTDGRARREAGRVMTRLAEEHLRLGDAESAARSLERALGDVAPLAGQELTARDWFNRGLVLERSYALHVASLPKGESATGNERAAQLARDAVEAYEQALTQDPYNMDLALRAFGVAERSGMVQAARRFAQRTIALDEYMRLDKVVRGLSETDRGRVLRTLGAP